MQRGAGGGVLEREVEEGLLPACRREQRVRSASGVCRAFHRRRGCAHVSSEMNWTFRPEVTARNSPSCDFSMLVIGSLNTSSSLNSSEVKSHHLRHTHRHATLSAPSHTASLLKYPTAMHAPDRLILPHANHRVPLLVPDSAPDGPIVRPRRALGQPELERVAVVPGAVGVDFGKVPDPETLLVPAREDVRRGGVEVDGADDVVVRQLRVARGQSRTPPVSTEPPRRLHPPQSRPVHALTVAKHLPSTVSHTFALKSALPVTALVPCRLRRAPQTAPLWPMKVPCQSPTQSRSMGRPSLHEDKTK